MITEDYEIKKTWKWVTKEEKEVNKEEERPNKRGKEDNKEREGWLRKGGRGR